MNRYAALLALALMAGAFVVLLARGPRRDQARPAAVETEAASLALTVGDSSVTPGFSSVPQGRRVRLEVEHRGSRRVTLSLAGYEDRVSLEALAPGARWSGEFVADRPGDDFVWLLDGRPSGRFAVTGSHLVEGHR